MQDERIAFDEARRLHQHGQVKGEIENRVHADLRASARGAGDAAAEAARIDALAGRLRGKAIANVAETEDEIERQRRFARLRQFVDYAFGLVYGLLGLRFLLALIDARQGSGFVRFINSLTAPLYAPFRGILPTPNVEQGYAFSSSILLAIVVYALAHFAIKGAMRVAGRRETEL